MFLQALTIFGNFAADFVVQYAELLPIDDDERKVNAPSCHLYLQLKTEHSISFSMRTYIVSHIFIHVFLLVWDHNAKEGV